MKIPKPLTTAQKLWFGFGMLTGLLVLVCAALFIRVRSIDAQVGEMTQARQRAAAARELEINVVGFALAVSDYLRTGDSKFRAEADEDAADVDKYRAEYERHAVTDRHREMTAKFNADWRQFQMLGQTLLIADNRQPNPADIEKFSTLRTALEAFLDDQQQREAEGEYAAREQATHQTTRNIVWFILILMSAVALIAVVTCGIVGRAVVKGEQVIAEQGERLRTTLASIGDAVITTDTNGCITNLNAVAEVLTGWTHADAVGQPLDTVFRIVNEETRQPVVNPAMKALKEGVIVGLANHTVLIAKDRTERPIDDSAAPIRCKLGEIVGCVLVFRDITERHRQEAELREQERQFHTLAESIPQLAWMANSDGHIFWYNRRWYQYTGTTLEKMEGWGWQSVHDPAELPKVLERWKASIATGQPFDMVFPLKGDDGLFRPFLTRVEPIKDEEGRVVRWFGTNTDITEQKRSEELLRASEQRLKASEANYRLIVECNPALICRFKADGALTFVNDTYCRTFGKKREELVGHQFLPLIPDEDKPVIDRTLEKLAPDMKPHTDEHRVVISDGEVRWQRWTNTAVVDDDGTFVAYQAVGIDITDRKAAEEAVRRSEERFRGIFMQTLAGIAETDLTGRFVQVNQRFCEILGRSADELYGLQMQDVTHPDDLTRNLSLFVQAVTHGTPFTIEKRYVRPDASVVWVSNSVSLVRDQEGQPKHIVAASLDITSNKRAEHALRDSEAHFRSMADNAPTILWVTDPTGYCTYLSERWAAMTGRPIETDLGFGWLEATHPDDRTHAETVFRDANERHAPFSIDYRLRRHDGEYYWAVDAGRPRFGPGGEFLGFVGTVTDVHDRKLAEQQVATTLDSISDGFMRFDGDWRVVYVNAEAERIVQRSRAEMVGKTHWELFPATVGTKVETEYRRAVAERVTVELENYYEPLALWVRIRCYPTPDGGLVIYFQDITDRKRGEERLREAAERLELAIDAAGMGGWEWNVVTNQVAWTPKSHDLFGVPTGTPVTLDVFTSRLHSDDVAENDRRTAESLTTGEYENEYRVRHGDGYRWIATRGKLLRDEEGRPVRMLGVVMDITARKEAEGEVREARSRLESTLAAGEIGTWEFDVVTNTVRGDPNLARMFGVSHDEAAGGPLEAYMKAIHPDDRDRVAGAIKQALDAGDGYETTYRLVAPGLPVRWIVARGRVEQDGAGRAVRLPGVVVDITNQRHAEEQLRMSEERFRALFDTMDEGFCVVEMEFDPAGRATDYRIVEMNPAFEKHTGQRELVGKSVRNSIPNLEEFWFETYGRVAVTGEPIRFVNEAKPMDRWFDVSAFRLVGPGSNKVAILFNDITDRKKAEQERERLVGQLREQDIRKDEFLATLAHELRNPLAPIRNGLQVLKLSNRREATEQARMMMERQLEQMVRLVDDLLDVSRISRGKLELKKERVLLEAVLSSAVETSRPLIDQMGHELTVTLPNHSIFLDADLTRLAQVFLNLLNNSAKYMERGGHIWLTTELQGSDVVVSVKDTGIGIAADHLPHIFHMFSQVDRSLEKAQGGLGIGLTLVKRLLELHGGSIDARSEGLGQGSEFVVRLPVNVEKSLPPVAERGEDHPILRSSLRILIVDDNRDGADSLSEMMKLMGNDTYTAYDGEEAVAVAAAVRPDVILLDIGLPKLNGYDACRRIREQQDSKPIVIIAQTGWGADEDRQRTYEAGFDHHMVKPVDPTDLMTMLAGVKQSTQSS